jgi:hypothetical protein
LLSIIERTFVEVGITLANNEFMNFVMLLLLSMKRAGHDGFGQLSKCELFE